MAEKKKGESVETVNEQVDLLYHKVNEDSTAEVVDIEKVKQVIAGMTTHLERIRKAAMELPSGDGLQSILYHFTQAELAMHEVVNELEQRVV